MKSWRRTCTVLSTSTPPTGVLVLSVHPEDDADFAVVTFNQPVTVNTLLAFTFVVNGNPTDITDVLSATQIEVSSGDVAIEAGAEWHWSGACPSITPTPNITQTGIVT